MKKAEYKTVYRSNFALKNLYTSTYTDEIIHNTNT